MSDIESLFIRGLSPLARGTQSDKRRKPPHHRFIPAGAGNTQTLHAAALIPAVYPRWRGEHRQEGVACYSMFGLSPLARGTHAFSFAWQPRKRFIPAGAGNTLRNVDTKAAAPVYPRWRGEHSVILALKYGPRGLSPLARGTPTAHRAQY